MARRPCNRLSARLFRKGPALKKPPADAGRGVAKLKQIKGLPSLRGPLQARGAASKPLNVAVCAAAGSIPCVIPYGPPKSRSTHAQACSRNECGGTGGLGRRVRSGAGRQHACCGGGSADAELHQARCGRGRTRFARSKRPTTRRVAAGFTSADANKDGYLSKAEYAQLENVEPAASVAHRVPSSSADRAAPAPRTSETCTGAEIASSLVRVR